MPLSSELRRGALLGAATMLLLSSCSAELADFDDSLEGPGRSLSTSSLEAHYRFDENTGNRAGDSAGAHHGTLSGPNWTSGRHGPALSFDGHDDHVSVPNSGGLNMGNGQDFTLSAWIKTSSRTPNIGDSLRIISKQVPGRSLYTLRETTGGHVEIAIRAGSRESGNRTYRAATSSTRVDNNGWRHVAGVRSGSTLRIYVDGNEDGRAGGASGSLSNSAPIYIGAYQPGEQNFHGEIDDVRIYRRALLACEIKELVGNGTCSNDDPPPPGVGQFPWSEDFSLADGTTSDSGSTSWSTSGDLRSAAVFSAQGSRFVASNTGSDGRWASQHVDISGKSARVSLDITGWGTLDASGSLRDSLRVFVSIDGGREQHVTTEYGAVSGTRTITSPIFTGNTLRVIVRSKTTGADEAYTWDNVRVEGGLNAPDAGMNTPDAGLNTPDAERNTPDAGRNTSDAGSGRVLESKTGVLFKHVEWTLENGTYSGNAYDLLATATFTHRGSDERHTTEMFYDGGDNWRFRFTGTRTGDWHISTSSDDDDLDGFSGTVHVDRNTDPRVRGFLTTRGNQFAIQTGSNRVEAHRFNVFMDGVRYPGTVTNMARAATVDRFVEEAARHGFDTIHVGLMHNVFKLGANTYRDHRSVDPDRTTFQHLEQLITRANNRGARVHFWMWGDEHRKTTPLGLPGGANGEVDRRMQRYIAARLGPLPGWTAGYGFDLEEWAPESMVRAWARHMHEHSGWRHLLMARGRSDAALDVKSYSDHHVRSYTQIVRDLSSDRGRPHLYEERHSYRRPHPSCRDSGEALSMSGTRRFLWNQTMAGGMGGFWGFYGASYCGFGGHPYPNPEQLATVSQFFDRRFTLGMERANGLTNGVSLRTPDNAQFVFYRENTSSIEIDLRRATGSRRAVAVDAQRAYAEVDLGVLNRATQTIDLPRTSDWAIAVGDF